MRAALMSVELRDPGDSQLAVTLEQAALLDGQGQLENARVQNPAAVFDELPSTEPTCSDPPRRGSPLPRGADRSRGRAKCGPRGCVDSPS